MSPRRGYCLFLNDSRLISTSITNNSAFRIQLSFYSVNNPGLTPRIRAPHVFFPLDLLVIGASVFNSSSQKHEAKAIVSGYFEVDIIESVKGISLYCYFSWYLPNLRIGGMYQQTHT